MNNVGWLSMSPHNFGTSGHKKRPPGNVIDNYWMRGPVPTPERSKIIAKPSMVTGVAVHYATVFSASKQTLDTSELLFNHYFTKSEEDWEIRCKKGTANGYFVVEPPYLPANPTGEQIEDRSIITKFSDKLKERMERPANEVVNPIPHTVV
jgi:hypothetical protein